MGSSGAPIVGALALLTSHLVWDDIGPSGTQGMGYGLFSTSGKDMGSSGIPGVGYWLFWYLGLRCGIVFDYYIDHSIRHSHL